MNASSYTAASAFPAKLFTDAIIKTVREHDIKPVHVQINPTNRCPLNCSFCSCKNMDRTIEMPLADLIKISEKFIRLGARAFTITGGGDPLAYRQLPQYVRWLYGKGIKTALVTNGVLFKKHDLRFLSYLSWCRISLSDERELHPEDIESVVREGFSFSYVIITGNLDKITTAIKFANEHNFSHVRLVDDIIGGSRISLVDIKERLVKDGVDISRVIWQGRKAYSRGHPRCLVSLLKPNIDAHGNFTPCCGVQYAGNPPALDFIETFRLKGSIKDIYAEQQFFNGSVCERCYYSDYNGVLNAVWDYDILDHKDFV